MLYWTSKQHKNPYKFRFIAGAFKCSTKQISIELAQVLKFIKNHFKNYCNICQQRSRISYYWSIDNSIEFTQKLAHVKQATSFETFDFSTLYTNLPLDDIYNKLELLIVKMFNNSPSSCILVNVSNKKTFWRGSWDHKGGYKEYTVDKVLAALKFVLYNSFVQFGGYIFQQVKGIPMGGNASPFIADLYLSWCEFTFMQSLSNTDADLARKFEFNSRFLDDIGVINFIGFADVAKRIYHPSLVLEKSDHSSLWDTFLDLFVRIVDNKFNIGIYHKVDDFNFEVISFPFTESNVLSSLGHKCFYSQIIRFHGLCNNVRDFITRVKLLYTKLIARGYEKESFAKSFCKCCSTFNINLKFGIADVKAFWNQILQFDEHSYCNISDNLAINSIVKPCSVILEDIYRKPKQKFAGQLKRCFINLLKIDESYTVSEEKGTYHMPDSKTACVPKHSYIPFGIENPYNHCYLNSILQVMFSILHHRPLDHVNNNSEGEIIRYIHDISNCNLSAANTLLLKSTLQKRHRIMGGRLQQDVHECFSIFT